MYYVFDFDGTLVDSMDVWAGAHIKRLKDAGIEVPDGFVKTITPLGNIGASKYTVSLGLRMGFEEYFEKLSENLNYEYRHNVFLKPTVKEMLLKWKAEGQNLSVFTASPHDYIDDCLKIGGVYDLFDNVWSITDYNCSKNETAAYDMLCEKLGCEKSECVMFDDNFEVIETAHKAGIKTVAVFDKYSADYADGMKEIADKYIYLFEDFKGF